MSQLRRVMLGGLVAVLAIAVLAESVSSIFPLVPPSNTTVVKQPEFQASVLKLGGVPSSDVYDPSNGYLYATYGDGSSGGIYVVNGTKLLANITTDSGPGSLLYDPSNYDVYMVGVNGHNVYVVQGTEVVATIPIVNHPTNLVYSPADHLVYLGTQQVDLSEPSIVVIDDTTVIGYIPANCSLDLCPMVYDPSNAMLYVANSGSDTVSIVNGTTVEYTLKVGPDPGSLFFSPQSNMIYVGVNAGGFGDKIAVIAGAEVVNITAGTGPGGFIYNNSTGDVYVINEGETTLSVIRNTSNIANVTLGFTPRFGIYDPSNGLVYVPDEDGSGVAIVNGTTVVATAVTGPRPDAIFFNPANNYVYVSNGGFVGICFGGCQFEPSNNVSIISGSTVLENVTVGWSPGSMKSDRGTGSVYVLTADGIALISGPGSTGGSAADTTSKQTLT